MHRLHLHVISRDMISDALKTKKHWNSFTTEFFIPSSGMFDSFSDDEPQYSLAFQDYELTEVLFVFRYPKAAENDGKIETSRIFGMRSDNEA